MSLIEKSKTRFLPMRQGLPPSVKPENVIYAMTVELAPEQLAIHYAESHSHANLEIRRVLERRQFRWQCEKVYFGDTTVSAASVAAAVIDLTTQLPWFAACVQDIRMLRIEEMNDLIPIVQQMTDLR